MSRPPKPITRRRLEAMARHHLDRWSASRAHLERLLGRRAGRALAAHGGDPAEVEKWIGEVLDVLEAEGVLDDDRMARDRARRMSERGVSSRAIRARLSEKGLAGEAIGDALQALGDTDLRAAAAYARKRRLGPYRENAAEWRDRDLARLARAGFSLGVALRILDADRDEIEAIELGLDEEER